MSNARGLLASKVIELTPFVDPDARQVHGRHRAEHAGSIRWTRSTPVTSQESRPVVQPPHWLHDADVLPRHEFLRCVHREMRRSERSGAALSLVLYTHKENQSRDHQDVDELMEVLLGSKRETDVLGDVGLGSIAMLCPDTDAEGAQGLVRKIEARANASAFETVSATYPNDLFEDLAEGGATPPSSHEVFFRTVPQSPGIGGAVKRFADVAGSLIALCLLAPLMLIVAVAVAITSSGPIIFRQTRVGKGGVPFTFYKFRSMVTHSDDSVHREFVTKLIKSGDGTHTLAGSGQAPFKLQSDPRITRVGRFIRKTSIDELPQLFNVLKGDMSLVGPRPPIPYEAAQYQAWHLRRVLAIKPGITGLWQVEGRSRVTFNDMVRMDLRYIRDRSLALDLKILLRTVAVVLRCDGAR